MVAADAEAGGASFAELMERQLSQSIHPLLLATPLRIDALLSDISSLAQTATASLCRLVHSSLVFSRRLVQREQQIQYHLTTAI